MMMSEEMAVRLHRMMWSDMQRKLGNNPPAEERKDFKFNWIEEHFPGEPVMNSCFLCEYAGALWAGSEKCKECPIRWPGDTCCPKEDGVHYMDSPISDILALPARNKVLEDELAEHDKDSTIRLAYCLTKEKLSKASGLDDFCTADEHISEIRKKADWSIMSILESASGLKWDCYWVTDHISEIQRKGRAEARNSVIGPIAEASGLDAGIDVFTHIKAIQDKAVEDYFNKMPLAKAMTSDVDEAFRQYAKEQKASNEKELVGIHEKLKDAVSTLCLYQSALSYESDLPQNAPVADHIARIREYAFSDGQDNERERIMDKIGEMLNDKPAGTCKDI